MAEKITEEKKPEIPGSDILLSLQNRINDLEAKLQNTEKSRSKESFVNMPFLDSKIAELRLEIGQLRGQKEREAATIVPDIKKEVSNVTVGNLEGKDGLEFLNIFGE